MKVTFKWESYRKSQYSLCAYIETNGTRIEPVLADVSKRRSRKWQVKTLFNDYHKLDYKYNATLLGSYKTLKEAKKEVEKAIKEIISQL